MLKDLENITLKSELVVKDNKAYSYFKDLNKYTEIDGCSFLKALKEQDTKDNEQLTSLQNQITELETNIETRKTQELALESAGYCDLSTTAYTRLGSVVTGEYLTHSKTCQHKGE